MAHYYKQPEDLEEYAEWSNWKEEQRRKREEDFKNATVEEKLAYLFRCVKRLDPTGNSKLEGIPVVPNKGE